jgi:hypothetical protein
VTVVTSAYHVRRASLQLSRCYRRMIFTVAARDTHTDVADFVHEWAGLLLAVTVHRRRC